MARHLHVAIATDFIELTVRENSPALLTTAVRRLRSRMRMRVPPARGPVLRSRVAGLVGEDSLAPMLAQALDAPDLVARQPFAYAHVELGCVHAKLGILAPTSDSFATATEFETYCHAWAANRWRLAGTHLRLGTTELGSQRHLVTAANGPICEQLEAFFSARKIRFTACHAALANLVGRPRAMAPGNGNGNALLIVRERGLSATQRTVQLVLMDAAGPREIAQVQLNDPMSDSEIGAAIRRLGCAAAAELASQATHCWWPAADDASPHRMASEAIA